MDTSRLRVPPRTDGQRRIDTICKRTGCKERDELLVKDDGLGFVCLMAECGLPSLKFPYKSSERERRLPKECPFWLEHVVEQPR